MFQSWKKDFNCKEKSTFPVPNSLLRVDKTTRLGGDPVITPVPPEKIKTKLKQNF